MNSRKRYVLAIIAAITISLPFMAQRPSDSETLGMALEYFQSGKYHEALLLFEKLDKEYVRGFKDAPYGKDVLVSQKRYYMENYPALAVEDGTLDQCLIVLAGKKEDKK